MSRILVLTSRFPFPTIRGDKLRIYNLCRGLARDHDLTLLSICESKEDLTLRPNGDIFRAVHRVYLPRWRSLLRSALALLTGEPLQLAYYRSAAFQRKIDELIPEHDLVLAHLIRTGQYVENRRDIPRVLEMTDALSRTYLRAQSVGGLGLMGRVYAVESERVLRYERRTLNNFDLVSLVSPTDRAFLVNGEQPRSERIGVYTLGTDLENRTWVGTSSVARVVFIGHMRSTPNIEACDYFVREVLPMIRSRVPEMRFRIVGSAAPKTIRHFRSYPGVEATGEVAEVSAAVGDVCCAVCPMRIGAGVQNKVLEYMALGLPAVVTPLAVEGIDAQPGRDLLVGRTAEEIAHHVLSLYENVELRACLSLRARNLVERDHSWPSVWDRFGSAVATVAESRSQHSVDRSVSRLTVSSVRQTTADVRSTVSG